MNLKQLITLVFISYLSMSCTNNNTNSKSELLDSLSFKDTIDNQEVNLYTLSGNNGFKVYLTNFGARIVSIQTPDKNGNIVDVALGFKTAKEYHNEKEPYFGTIVGPVANRIAKGKFSIDGQEYTFPINNGPNTLHGGRKGLHFVVWNTEVFKDSIRFSYNHAHLQEGFPGNKNMSVTYAINDQNELAITYKVTTDQDTYINLSNHTYFNMNGEGSGNILGHQLLIHSDSFTPVDSTLIPTGVIQSTKDTPFHFKTIKSIGQDINAEDQQLVFGKGYDHNYILDGTKGKEMNHAAKIIGDISGVVMDIYTTEPGLQFYSGNFMNEIVTLKNGSKDSFRTGLCLEPQNYPDAPNQANFPNSKIQKEQTYNSKTIYSFSIN